MNALDDFISTFFLVLSFSLRLLDLSVSASLSGFDPGVEVPCILWMILNQHFFLVLSFSLRLLDLSVSASVSGFDPGVEVPCMLCMILNQYRIVLPNEIVPAVQPQKDAK